MIKFTIVSIVEGYGEIQAVPLLIRRVAQEYATDVSIDASQPIRIPRSKITKQDELERAVTLAAFRVGKSGGLLLILDADDDCPASLGPQLLARAKGAVRGRVGVSVVLAKSEFEAWFLAAAKSLRGKRGLPPDLEPPTQPEAIRNAKGWLSDRMGQGSSYSEVLDQPALAAMMDLTEARDGSPSFDKFYRDLRAMIDSGRR